jgi:hypothetical protein
MLNVAAVVTGSPDAQSSHRTRNAPKWFKAGFKDRLQSLNAQESLGEIAEVPTFFRRRNKDGKIMNAFEQDTWFEIHARHSGKIKFSLVGMQLPDKYKDNFDTFQPKMILSLVRKMSCIPRSHS